MAVRLIVAEINGPELEEVPWKTISYTDVYNDAGPISFEVSKRSPLCNPALLAPGQRELHLYLDGTLRWGGYLWAASGSAGSTAVSFAGASYLSRFGRRYVSDDQTYTDEEQLDIAWALIDYTQTKAGGDLGITDAGVGASGVLRTIAYAATDRTKILDALQTLASGDDGFDYEIRVSRTGDTVNRVWTPGYPTLGQQQGAVLVFGKNVSEYTYELNADDTTSERTAIGSSDSGDAIPVAVADDPTALATYGLLEDADSYSDVDDVTLLQGHANEDETNHSSALETLSIVVKPLDIDAGLDTFSPGDTLKVGVTDGYYVSTLGYRRVASRQIDVDPEGQLKMTVNLDRSVM